MSGTLALGREPERASLTLAFLLRWRVRDAGVGKGAKTGFLDAGVSIALACEGRWRRPDAGVGKGSQNWIPDADVSIVAA